MTRCFVASVECVLTHTSFLTRLHSPTLALLYTSSFFSFFFFSSSLLFFFFIFWARRALRWNLHPVYPVESVCTWPTAVIMYVSICVHTGSPTTAPYNRADTVARSVRAGLGEARRNRALSSGGLFIFIFLFFVFRVVRLACWFSFSFFIERRSPDLRSTRGDSSRVGFGWSGVEHATNETAGRLKRKDTLGGGCSILKTIKKGFIN